MYLKTKKLRLPVGKWLGAAGGLLFSVGSMQGAFELVQDFESGVGDLTWTQGFSSGEVAIVTDPIPTRDLSNQVLSAFPGTAAGNTVRIQIPIPEIADQTSGTVYFRFAIDNTDGGSDAAFNVSPMANPEGHGNSNVLMVANPAGALVGRDGTTYETVVADRASLTWYEAWYVIDTSTRTYDIHLKGGDLTEATLVADDFAFREDTTELGLETFAIIHYSGTAAPLNLSTVYLDDLYVDTEGENLANPAMENFMGDAPLRVVRRAGAITLDGVLEDQAYSLMWAPLTQISGVVSSVDDLSAILYSTYDEEGVYVFIDVTDDVVNADSPAAHQDDSLELYFDPTHNSSGNFDNVDDFKIVARFPANDGDPSVLVGGFPTPAAGADLTDLDGTVVTTDNGWAAEIFVPWAGFQMEMPIQDWTMGFAVQISDDDGVDSSDPADGVGDVEGRLYFARDASEQLNFNTENFSELTLLASKEIQLSKITTAITIDGVQDEGYDASWINQTDGRWLSGIHPEDTSVEWRAVLDEENLYLFFDITDSAVVDDSTADYHDDSLELFLDGNNSKSGSFDGQDDVKITFVPHSDGTLGVLAEAADQFPDPPVGTDFSGLEAMHTTGDDGWTLEVKVPLSVMKFTPTPGEAFGIGFALNDDDGLPLNDNDDVSNGGERDGILTWSSGRELNSATDAMGTAYVWTQNSAEIAETTGDIVIDGNVEANYGDTSWHIINRPGNGNARPAPSDVTGYWMASYGSDAFYLVVESVDDVLSSTSDSGWKNDGIELYFDPSNDSSGNFDGSEDFKLVIVPNYDPVFSVGGFPAAPTSLNSEGLDAAWALTTSGWRVEVKVPFTMFGLTPMGGTTMGFDIQLADNDDGGERDAFLTWSGMNELNFNTQMYGDITFIGDVMFPYAIGATVVEGNAYDSWLGGFTFDAAHNGWLLHEGFGWLWAPQLELEQSAFWVYSYSLGEWVYFSESAFPHVYAQSSGWAYYAYFGDNVGFLYDYGTASWIEIQ